ncbi:MAG TPA: single-stranded-DNA-specific exonuclease RecJ [Phycisphaerae bacterium]|nr:single-stranded-DNA-specific exonuclease RecJ [Phycisphaerae bacterium]
MVVQARAMEGTAKMENKSWSIAPAWPECRNAAQRLGVSPLVAQVLFNRGIMEPDRVRAFLDPKLSHLHAPESLPGVTQAAERIARAVRDRESIVIYGDYDADGLTGTAILWHLLTLAGARVSYYIPHRIEEGYGVNSDAIRQIRQDGADLLITVDCGITAVEQIRLARALGLAVVITDHHAFEGTLPEAEVVVHPRAGEGYPNPDLCGAGVAFKLAWAAAKSLCGAEKVHSRFRDFLVDATGLVALGTIADVVPLTGENRVLARHGLTGLAKSKLTGIMALIEAARLTDQKLDSEHVGFWLAPRLNSAGRMADGELAAELLTSATPERAREIALLLERHNQERKSLERRIFDEACAMIEARHLASDARRGIVLASENWHAGVIGIVASRVVERYRRPTIIIALDSGQGQGSGRSIPHFELNHALAECREHLIAFGGHAMAAGLRIAADRIESFTAAFVARANQRLTAQDLEPTLRLDAETRLSELSEQTVQQIEQLAPFGQGNPRPKFASGALQVDGEPRVMGASGEHLSFHLSDGHQRCRAVAFSQKDHLPALLQHRRCQVAFTPRLNTFRGCTNVEMQVVDIRCPV